MKNTKEWKGRLRKTAVINNQQHSDKPLELLTLLAMLLLNPEASR